MDEIKLGLRVSIVLGKAKKWNENARVQAKYDEVAKNVAM